VSGGKNVAPPDTKSCDMNESEKEAREVTRWRCEQLTDVGFAPPAASRLAGDPRYDLHALIELVERGCPPDLALRILAPLDSDAAAA
jgi:hypothetical protein